jgi:hypothetical protein
MRTADYTSNLTNYRKVGRPLDLWAQAEWKKTPPCPGNFYVFDMIECNDQNRLQEKRTVGCKVLRRSRSQNILWPFIHPKVADDADPYGTVYDVEWTDPLPPRAAAPVAPPVAPPAPVSRPSKRAADGDVDRPPPAPTLRVVVVDLLDDDEWAEISAELDAQGS